MKKTEPQPSPVPNILLIENNIANKALVENILSNPSYEIIVTESYELALQQINKNLPLLILLATNLKEEDSFQLCAKLKDAYLTKDIPIILLGNDNDEDAAMRGFDAGAVDFINIHLHKKELIAKIKVHIAQRQIQVQLENQNKCLSDKIDASVYLEEQQRKMDDPFRSMVENANDTVFSLTPDAVLIYASPNWTRVVGHDVKDFIGTCIFDTLIHPDDIPTCLSAIEKAIKTGEKQAGIEYRILHKNGSWRWQTTNASPVFDKNGIIISFLGIARDISDQKMAEEALIKSELSYHGLFNSVEESIYILDENGFFIDVNVAVEKMYGYTREEILGKTPEFLSAPDSNNMQQVSALIKDTFANGKSGLYNIWGIRKNGESFPKEISCSKGKYFGKDVLIITARDISDRIKTHLALKVSEEKLSKIFHLSPDAIILTRVSDGVIVDVNERALDMSGFSRKDLIGKTTLELKGWLDLPDRNQYVSLLQKQGRVINLEKTFRTKSGEPRYTTISGEIIEINEENFILTVIHDITHRKKAEEEIKEWATQLQILGDNLPDTMVFQLVREVDGTMKFTYLSKGIEKITGKTSEEVLRNTSILYDLIDKQDLPLVKRAEKESFHHMSLFDVDIRFHNYKAEIRWFHIRSKPRLLADGRVIWDGVQTDITDRKMAEHKMAESEEKYRLLVENALDIIYTLDAELKIRSFNHVGAQLLGYTQEEILGKASTIVLETADLGLTTNMLHKKLAGQEKTRYELNLIAKDGQVIPVEVQTRLLYKNGVFDGVLGIARDISERKKADTALQKTLKELSDYKYALDQAANVSLSDENGYIKYVNDRFCKQYGYSFDEIVGQNHVVLNSNYHPNSFWKAFWETIQKGEVLKAEVRNQGKDGKLYWSDTTIVPFLNTEGIPYQYLAIRSDITEKRKLEEELADQQLYNQRLITELTIQEQENERNNISNELHENVNQILAGAKIYLGLAQTKSKNNDALLEKSSDYLNQAMDLINNLSNSLVAPTLNDFGLLEALKDLVEKTNHTSQLKVMLYSETAHLEPIENNRMIMLYRVIKQQLHTIATLAKASTVSIHLQIKDELMYLSISDDGPGMDISEESLGLDLVYIRNRVEFYSGSLQIISAPDKGCTLKITIPLKQRKPALETS
jgi:PAS domain S-box-containing protein